MIDIPLDATFKTEDTLDGTTLHYRYLARGWEFELSFYNGLCHYFWLGNYPGKPLPTERPAEPHNKDIPYKAIRVGANEWFVHWHEEDLKDNVTLLINFDNSTVHGAGITKYDHPAGPDFEVHRHDFFHNAFILAVKGYVSR